MAELLVAELRRRDLEVPPQPLFDIVLDEVLAPADPVRRLQLDAELVTSLARGGARLARFLHDVRHDNGTVDDETGGRPEGDDGRADERPGPPQLPVDIDRTVPVELDDAGRAHLDRTAARGWLQVAGVSTVPVTLRGTGEPDSGEIVVEVGGQPVGTIAAADATPFRSALQPENLHWLRFPRGDVDEHDEAAEPDDAATTRGFVRRYRDGRPTTLHVGTPTPPFDPQSLPDTLSERVGQGRSSSMRHFFLRHCVVCGDPVQPGTARAARIGRPGAPTHGRAPALAHPPCWDEGARRAAAEGLHWEELTLPF